MARPARLGVLVPGGNPTVEPELYRMAPASITIHFARLRSPAGEPGATDGLENRTLGYLDVLPDAVRAIALGREADVPSADAILISATGLPTVGIVERLERDLGKPVVTSQTATLWYALRALGVTDPVRGYGRLLTGLSST